VDRKWVEQKQQDRRQLDDQAWLFRDWVAGGGSKPPDPNDFPTGEPHWIVRFPALLILPLLAFGSCLFAFTLMWLSAGR
jgi:hypothetical protein